MQTDQRCHAAAISGATITTIDMGIEKPIQHGHKRASAMDDDLRKR